MSMIVAVVGLGLLIAAHEAGHLLFARLMGMRVETYSLGFGPRIFGFRRGETDYRISAIPLGGYCKIAGFTPEEHEEDHDPNDTGSYLNKPAWRRFIVIAAGPLINYLTAFALLLALFAFIGIPSPTSFKLDVVPEGPAARAGVLTGDEVTAVDGVPIHSFQELAQNLGSSAAPERKLSLRRGNQALAVTVKPENSRIQVGALHVYEHADPGAALRMAIDYCGLLTTGTFGALADLVRHRTIAGLAGPVGIVKQASAAVKLGLADFMLLLANISVSLAVFNFLPIPALDGGRLVFLGWEVVTRRRVPRKLEEVMTVIGWLALLALILTVVVFGDFQLGRKLFSKSQ